MAPGPAAPAAALPAWVTAPAPAEERPPRPLAPSAAGGGDDSALLPPTPAMRAAARRGQVLHQLFERIGTVAAERREMALRAWLQRNAPELDAEPLVAEVTAVLALPAAAPFFAPGALAEAPLSALVGDRAVTGSIDRLVVGADHVAALDFKTGLFVPSGEDTVPAYHRRQMQAYAEALKVIFPGRKVTTALLYTAAPRLILLDEAELPS